MRQLIKSFLCVGGLLIGLQSAWGFALLGPVANGGDAWQVTLIGYNPMAGLGPPWITDDLPAGPKNLGEGYRRNTPVMYYTFDSSFGNWFGASGETAVEQAFDILNNAFTTNNVTGRLTNGVDSYSPNLAEWPLNSQSENYTAQALGLLDLKSTTLTLLLEQMGLADAVRYTWALHDRYIPAGASCTPAAYNNSVGYEYRVIQRNFDVITSPLNQFQYSPYVNDELYSYYIYENCGQAGASPPDADALEIPLDPLNNNPPVASGSGEDPLPLGYFYTGLTRDDVGGLRWLYSTNNYDTPSAGYLESPAAGSTLISGSSGSTFTNINDKFSLITSNLTVFILTSATNNPAALQALYPGLVISSVITNHYSGTFTYTFANVVTNSFSTNTPVQYQIQNTTIAPPGTPTITTNFINTNLNIASGDFFILPTNLCGLDVLSVLATNVTAVTNFLGAVTNANAPESTNYSGGYTLTTFNLLAFDLASLTNNPTALQALYPGLVISSVITNSNGTFTYTFANVVINHSTNLSLVQYQVVTTTIGAVYVVGWPIQYYTAAHPLLTTNTFIRAMTNIVSGDFFLVPTNLCGLDILSNSPANATAVTNFLGTVTNTTAATTNYITTNTIIVSTNYTLRVAPCENTTIITSTNLVILSTNHTLLVAPCEFQNGATSTTPTNGGYEGIERIQFVRVPDGNYDYMAPGGGQFYQPITNRYTMVMMNGSTVTFQRVVTKPDFVFAASDMASGPSGLPVVGSFTRNVNFNQANVPAGLAGPGTIDPPSTITFDKVGPVYENSSPSSMSGPNTNAEYFIWASFDGTTNAPIVYPNGTSLANLGAEALIQISPLPPALPNGANGVAYSVTFSATGGNPPYNWALAPGSTGLPPGLTLSGNVISGTPTNSATYDNIVIQMTDSSSPAPLSVDMDYSITIN